MKTIGLIGGLSPESTLLYYKHLNDLTRAALGGHHSAKIILWSVNFEEFCQFKEKGDWETQERLLSDAATKLEQAGADFLVIATNTMHKMASEIQSKISIPLMHIADATAQVAIDEGYKHIGFLGTKYSMELDFYTGRLVEKGLTPLIPETQEDRDLVSAIIYDELTKGVVTQKSEQAYIDVIERLKQRGAQAVILGCTEITMLVNKNNSPLPILDTTQIHVEQAVKKALA